MNWGMVSSPCPAPSASPTPVSALRDRAAPSRRLGTILALHVSQRPGSRYSPFVVALRAVPSTPTSDADLVRGAREGEAWAADALVRRHQRRLNGLAFRLMGRDADVDDLVQESFASALVSLERLKEPEAF